LAQYTGPDHLITGSDYGHNDPAEQAQLVKQMQSREDVAPALIEKILCDNPRQFYRI
jgi:predicted TIM-barrel fold metal-dependent hydrolase